MYSSYIYWVLGGGGCLLSLYSLWVSAVRVWLLFEIAELFELTEETEEFRSTTFP